MADKENLNLGNIILIKISLIGFLFSFCILFFLEEKIETKVINISDISLKDIEKNVVIIGNFKNVRVNFETMFGEFYDETGKLKVVAFKFDEEIIKISKYDKYKLLGKIKYYENELEIIANEIIKL
ncbi:MAG: OB-fold nucleic acid binding domain-containing protein [Nanoarchaeota archaeon]|nr:OB-fold nucleic acid binding domain-containing protein [Nanoarchaeota archaeon]